jgi:hypothetical protein
MFYLAEKLARGGGWFSVVVGGALGAAFGFFSQRAITLDPGLTHQILTHVLFGHLPTFFVSSFVLLRVSFQLTIDPEMRAEWTQGEQATAYSLSCAVVSLMVWAWFFLAVMMGYWLGMMLALSGYALPVWNAFWFDFDLAYVGHAALRMMLLALALSVMTFIEVNYMQTHKHQLGMLMSRFMTIGMFLIVSIEVLDVMLM